MAAAVPFIIMGVSMLGSMKSAQSAKDQGEAAATAQRFNAAAAQRDAQVARDQAAQDASAKQIEGIKKIGAARAAYGAAGITSEGSPLDVLANTASSIELDRQTILYKGRLKAMGYEDESTLDLMAATNSEKAGQEKASSTLLSGAGKAFSMFGST